MEKSKPWNRVNVDLVGPLNDVHASNGKFQLSALTVIDPAAGWFETTESKDTKAATVAAAFESSCEFQFPRLHSTTIPTLTVNNCHQYRDIKLYFSKVMLVALVMTKLISKKDSSVQQ